MEFTIQEKLLQKIVHKAWEDESFKNQLINSPIESIQQLTGEKVQFPEGKTLIVRDQTNESTIYINIPAKQIMDDVELNEEELEIVAGGSPLPFTGCFPSIPILIPTQGGDAKV